MSDRKRFENYGACLEKGSYMVVKELSGLSVEDKDPFIRFLHKVIRGGVKVLAALMVLIILWGILDVAWVFYQKLQTPPTGDWRCGVISGNYLLAAFSKS